MKRIFIYYFFLIFVFTQTQACKPRSFGRLYGNGTASGNDEADLVYINQFTLPLYMSGGAIADMSDNKHLKQTIDILKRTANPIVQSAAALALIKIINAHRDAIDWKLFFPNYTTPMVLAGDLIAQWISPRKSLGASRVCGGYTFRVCNSDEMCDSNLVAEAQAIEADESQAIHVEKLEELESDIRCLEPTVSREVLKFKLNTTKLWHRFYTQTTYASGRTKAETPVGDPNVVRQIQNEAIGLINQNRALFKIDNGIHYFKKEVIQKVFVESIYRPNEAVGKSFAEIADLFASEPFELQAILMDRLKFYLSRTDETFNGLTRLAYLTSRVNQVNLTPWLDCIKGRVSAWFSSASDDNPYGMPAIGPNNGACPAIPLTARQAYDVLAGQPLPTETSVAYALRELYLPWRVEYMDTINHVMAKMPRSEFKTYTKNPNMSMEQDHILGMQETMVETVNSIKNYFTLNLLPGELANREKEIALGYQGFHSWKNQIDKSNEYHTLQNSILMAQEAVSGDKNKSNSTRREAFEKLEEARRNIEGVNLKYQCYDYKYNPRPLKASNMIDAGGQPTNDGMRLLTGTLFSKCWAGWMMKLDTEKVVRSLYSFAAPVPGFAASFNPNSPHSWKNSPIADQSVRNAEWVVDKLTSGSFNNKKDPFEEKCLGKYNAGGFAPPNDQNLIPLANLCNANSAEALEARMTCWLRAQKSYEGCVQLSRSVEIEIWSTAVMLASGSIAFRGLSKFGMFIMRGQKISTMTDILAKAGFKLGDIWFSAEAMSVFLRHSPKTFLAWAGRSLGMGATFTVINKVILKALINMPVMDPNLSYFANSMSVGREILVGAMFMGVMPAFDRLSANVASRWIAKMPEASRGFQKQIAFWVPGAAEVVIDQTLQKNVMDPFMIYFSGDEYQFLQKEYGWMDSIKNTFIFRAVSARVDVKHVMSMGEARRIINRRANYETAMLMRAHQNVLNVPRNLLLDLGVVERVTPGDITPELIQKSWEGMVDKYQLNPTKIAENGLHADAIAESHFRYQQAEAAYQTLRNPQALAAFRNDYQQGRYRAQQAPPAQNVNSAVFDHAQ